MSTPNRIRQLNHQRRHGATKEARDRANRELSEINASRGSRRGRPS